MSSSKSGTVKTMLPEVKTERSEVKAMQLEVTAVQSEERQTGQFDNAFVIGERRRG